MPIISCNSRQLFSRLGREYTESEFTDLCFDFGIELDEVTNEREMYVREVGKENICKKTLEGKSAENMHRIELPANRYDLLSIEGLVKALRVFLCKDKPPQFKLLPPNPQNAMEVKPSILPIRPYVVCAILRDIEFTQERYDSFIDLQEKLHGNIARQRTLCSVGTHDLNSVKGPFRYEATPKADIDFLPLAHAGRGNLKGSKIEEYYKGDKHIGRYVPLVTAHERFPAVYDSNGTLMSLPPIINSDHSKISLDTKNVFVEVTATDYTKANIVLNMIVASFSEYSAKPFTIEPVEVTYPEKLNWVESEKVTTPNIAPRTFSVGVDYINKAIGIDISCKEMCTLLEKMLLSAVPSADESRIEVQVPCSRADILHECDIMEDVAIAYGYKNILKESKPPQTLSYGKQQPREAMRHLMRTELGLAGYTEMMTFSLCQMAEATEMCARTAEFYGGVAEMKKKRGPDGQIEGGGRDFEVCRPSLLPGTLKTLNNSKSQKLPLRMFEVTDVVLLDKAHRLGVRNETRVCAVRADANTAGFSDIHGLFDHTMQRLGVPQRSDAKPDGYYYEHSTGDACFFPGWEVSLFYKKEKIGQMGIIHPQVLKNFDIPFPCSYMEFNLEPFFQ